MTITETTETDLGNGVTEVTERNVERPTIATPIEMENPFAPATLAARIDALTASVRRLRNELYGDQVAMELHQREKAGHVTPRTPEPPAGALASLRAAISKQDYALVDGLRALIKRFEDNEKQWQRINAFFEPVLRDKNPPLDGEQIVSRRQLDSSLEILAGALRGEFGEARAFVERLQRNFRGTNSIASISDRVLRVQSIADVLHHAWEWTVEQRNRKPGVLKSARLAIANAIAPR